MSQSLKLPFHYSDYSFPFKMWLLSRFLIGFVILCLAPLLSVGDPERAHCMVGGIC